MKRGLLFVILVFSGACGPLFAQANTSEAFGKLRGLAGNWEGTFAWTGDLNSTGKMEAHYYNTGDAAVVENLISDGVVSMTSVYHLDGADLRATHFCVRNQPRLKATALSPDNNQITFSFVDVTNLRSATAGHVDGLEVQLLAPDHVTLRFHYRSGGKESFELVDLRRKNDPTRASHGSN
jgi:hypothetical protein